MLACQYVVQNQMFQEYPQTVYMQNFATCEMIMSEKHTFLVSILDGMDKKVADIGEKLLALESRVQTLEKNQNLHLLNAQQIFQASNCRQNDLEKKTSRLCIGNKHLCAEV